MLSWLRESASMLLLMLCVALGFSLYVTSNRLETKTAALTSLTRAVATQKETAAAELRTANASVLAQTRRWDEARASQEKVDVQNAATVDSLRDDLRLMRLRNRPEGAGRGGGGGGAAGATGAPADYRAAGGASGARILPASETGAGDEGDDDAFLADEINVAYRSCRNMLISERAAPTSAAPAAGP